MSNLATPTPLKFQVRDKALTAEEILREAPKIKRIAPLAESFHKGFRVEGHPPGALEEAKEETDAEYAHFERLRQIGQSNGKPPKPWNEAVWRSAQKKRPVRAKPYEVLDAAVVCKTMAEKAGWIDVEVREVKRVVNASA